MGLDIAAALRRAGSAVESVDRAGGRSGYSSSTSGGAAFMLWSSIR